MCIIGCKCRLHCITRSDALGILELKSFLQSKFKTKELGQLNCFLGIEVTKSKKGIFLSQRRYVLDLLNDVEMLEARPCDIPMVPNVKLTTEDGEILEHHERF